MLKSLMLLMGWVLFSNSANAEFLLGAGLHLGLSERRGYFVNQTTDVLAKTPFNSFRDDIPWADYESVVPGRKRIDDVFTLSGNKKNVPLLILNGPISKNHGSDFIFSEVGRKSYAEWALEIVERVGRDDLILEIWNEWNLSWDYDGKADTKRFKVSNKFTPENYALLVHEVNKIVKEKYPNVRIVVGAVGEDIKNIWLSRFLEATHEGDYDGVSLHLYNHCGKNKSADALFAQLKNSSDLIINKNKNGNVYITEFGWPDSSIKCAVGIHDKISNIAKFVALSRTLTNVKGVWVYELKNSGISRLEFEDNFGLYDFDWGAKEGLNDLYAALDLMRRGGNFKFLALSEMLGGGIGFDVDNENYHIIWSKGGGLTYDVRDGKCVLRHIPRRGGRSKADWVVIKSNCSSYEYKYIF